MTGSQVFALAHGQECGGPHQCLFCGAPASDAYELKDTFTARSTLVNSGGSYACRGCLLTLEESGTSRHADGLEKIWTKAFRRSNTWCWSRSGAVAFAGSHLAQLRAWLLCPPAPPWGACLVGPTNGRQLLYLTPATLDTRWHWVLVHGEPVGYEPRQLVERLQLLLTVAAIAGRPSIDGEPSPIAAGAVLVARPGDGESVVSEWCRVWLEPLSRLAGFLVPKREDCADALASLDAAAAYAG